MSGSFEGRFGLRHLVHHGQLLLLEVLRELLELGGRGTKEISPALVHLGACHLNLIDFGP